ncbi:hypothetical protein [Nitrosococcus halophilus]|uniref:hypothetical protein n=1 Tax=Nitrosococcus halophilus TaxID=133539 RepID=UPI0002FA3F59|nr:hypothetical protein [Nitrosococcus halophilus]
MTRTRLESALWEADRHLAVLEQAMASWAAYGEVANLDEIEGDPHRMRIADQVLFRFMKLQDALGMRLVRGCQVFCVTNFHLGIRSAKRMTN